MTKVEVVVSDDIAQVEADVLIASYYPHRPARSRLDRAIQAVAGDMFHLQARLAGPPYHDYQTIYAPASASHAGRFQAVLFVVDNNPRIHIDDLVFQSLMDADLFGANRVSLPLVRTGIHSANLALVLASVGGQLRAVKNFAALGSALQTIKLVVERRSVFNSQAVADYLIDKLNLSPSST